MYLCVQKASSQHSLALQPCRPNSLLLTAFPAWFIRHRLLHLSPRSLPSPPPLVPERPQSGQGALVKGQAFITACWLPPHTACQSAADSGEQFVDKQWEHSSTALSPQRPCAPTRTRKELAPSGEAALTPLRGEGFHGTRIAGLYSCHSPSPAVTRRD